MIAISDSQIEDATSILAVANIPGYVFRHLRAKDWVQAISTQFAPNDLLQAVDQLIKDNSGDEMNRVKAIVLLVVISHLPYSRELLSAVEALETNELLWGNEVKSLVLKSMTPVLIIAHRIQVAGEPSRPVGSDSSTTSVYSVISMPVSPKEIRHD
ncbi:MAG: hypothetical protein IPH75_10375 [bacterium]|nr:hypothetical protein [bacterium]